VKAGEAAVMLDMVVTIYKKRRNIIYEKVLITTDNR